MVAGRSLGLVLFFIALRPGSAAPPGEPSQEGQCVRCCDPPTRYPESRRGGPSPLYPTPHVYPHINITILKGDKGDRGERGSNGKVGKEGAMGLRGPSGAKGDRGHAGMPGGPNKQHYSAFSVGRKKGLHSSDYYQTLVFDTTFVNLHGHFNMFKGKFYCYVPGVYYFNLNIHTWNFKETYLHIMKNDQDMAICYAQPSDRSIMQSQSIMLELQHNDEVWVRLYKRERENAVYSDDVDTYVTFNGYLIKASLD
ncbi:complement C1q tumor necrosis factor-related protein 1-like [Amblyraja radiata]|uniref:complement C1q tumor necrosis factor-related protein 1-like n=1 Tax=Amblyraja radiata TaxID=386614 RepID=UPI001403B764|nr:complement C1q tumor necrosis factor-related protein 1-like [Amblyraja radiata]XP_032869149.1 complement C1q tumor necrosis factor-related protein 1-like [Amblyraja radiata]